MKKNEQFVFGIRAIIEAIDSGKEIDKVLVDKSVRSELMKELTSLLRRRNIPFQYVPVQAIERHTRKNHQGAVAFISEIVYQDIEQIIPTLYEEGKNPFILILDKITDVRNFGAIARSAECAGVQAIVIPSRGAAQINADAIKTSAGALHKIPVCRVVNLKETIDFLKNSGIQIVAATEKSKEYYYNTDFTSPSAIIMGAEDKGVSPEYLKITNSNVCIPLLGEIESLNVSAATTVMLYEVVKQRI